MELFRPWVECRIILAAAWNADTQQIRTGAGGQP